MSKRKVEHKRPELIVNVFIFVTTGTKNAVVSHIGWKWHKRAGGESELLAYLQNHVDEDWPLCDRRPLPDTFWVITDDGVKRRGFMTYPTFQQTFFANSQKMLEYLVFQHCPQAPRDPVVCMTPIVDGKPKIEGMTDLTGSHL